MEQQFVPVASVVLSPFNPRKIATPEADAELVASIRQVGVLEPLLVRTNGSAATYELVAGSRRLAAAKAAELAEVPVRVLELTDDQALEVMIVENLQRQDVHPLDEATGYATLIEHGHEVAAIAAKVGKSESYVRQRLQLKKLSPTAVKWFAADRLNAAQAMHLARIPEKEQNEVLSRMDGEEFTAAQLGRKIEQQCFLDLHGAPFKKDDVELLPKAGSCVACPKRTGASPMLFPDIAKKDTCTDRVCFHAKVAAHMEREKTRLKEKGEKVVEVRTDNWTPRGQKEAPGLAPHTYRRVEGKTACEFTKAGLVTDGRERGHVIKVCTDTQCKTHSGRHLTGRTRTGPSPAEKAAAAKQKAETARRLALFTGIVAMVKGLPTSAEDLRLVARRLIERTFNDDQKRLLKFFGLEPVTTKHSWGSTHDYEEPLLKLMETSDVDLGRVLMAASLMNEVYMGAIPGQASRLTETAKRLKVEAGEAAQPELANKSRAAKWREKKARVKAAAPKKPAKPKLSGVAAAARLVHSLHPKKTAAKKS